MIIVIMFLKKKNIISLIQKGSAAAKGEIMNVIHSIVFLQNWGTSVPLVKFIQNNQHAVSAFHIMGKHSYLLDANFDSKSQMENWINTVKSITLSSGIPAVIAMESQKIIEALKTKSDFGLEQYLSMKEKNHFFMKIDNPHGDARLISILYANSIMVSILHVQGACSFICEVIADEYEKYKMLLKEIKLIESVHHIETQEVVMVLKYRNKIIDESGALVLPENDIRELYTL